MTATVRSDNSARGIATLTLDRADRLNAFNQTMMDELLAQLETLEKDARVRVVVLRGAGKHFSSGADMARPEKKEGEVKHTGFIDIFRALETMSKPTIAVVQGACVGGAVAVVACCDVVLATDTAFFSIPEVRIGVAPVGVTPPLVRAMGLRDYRRLALLGDRFAAAEARHVGLVHEVCALEALEERIAAVADAFLLGAPGALSGLKAHLRATYPAMLAELETAHAHHARVDTFKTPEALEGVAAFKDKRKPSWYPPR